MKTWIGATRSGGIAGVVDIFPYRYGSYAAVGEGNLFTVILKCNLGAFYVSEDLLPSSSLPQNSMTLSLLGRFPVTSNNKYGYKAYNSGCTNDSTRNRSIHLGLCILR